MRAAGPAAPGGAKVPRSGSLAGHRHAHRPMPAAPGGPAPPQDIPPMPLDPPRADARRRRPSLPFALAGIAVLGTAGAAHAQVSPALDRFSLSVGAFSAKPEVS